MFYTVFLYPCLKIGSLFYEASICFSVFVKYSSNDWFIILTVLGGINSFVVLLFLAKGLATQLLTEVFSSSFLTPLEETDTCFQLEVIITINLFKVLTLLEETDVYF